MKKIYFSFSALAILVLSFSNTGYSQAFRKHSFVIGVSEGSTFSHYSTFTAEGPVSEEPIHGVRDPFTLEFGLTNKWGIGVNMGNDIFDIDPSRFYGTDAYTTANKSVTSEFTLDLHYHFFVTQKTDLSMVGSFGSSSVTMKEKVKDADGLYSASGNIVRCGLVAKYYFWKHLGVQGMLTSYSANCSTPIKDSPSTFGKGYSTSIRGTAIEFGLCYRFGKLVKPQASL